MTEEDNELGTIVLTYESGNKRVEMAVSEEPTWPEQLHTFFEFLRAVGYFIDPEVDSAATKAAWEAHHNSFNMGVD